VRTALRAFDRLLALQQDLDAPSRFWVSVGT
jgi:hypothetical protein